MTTLLIVDDRPINREVLSILLDEHGYTLLEAEDGLQALELVRSNNIDLIITDIAMPRMDGLTLVKELQADRIFKKIPVIFYSATYKAAEAYRMANSSNVRYVLTKPCEPEIILGTIEGALDPNSPFFNNKALRVSENKEIESLPRSLNLGKKDKLENVNMRLTNLIEISLDMSLEHDIEKLTYILCKGGRQFLDASYAGVLLKDSSDPTQYRNFVVSEDNTVGFHQKIETKNFSESLNELFLSEKALCIHSPIVDIEKLGLNDVNLPFSSLLTLPLKTTKASYGKIYFINKRNRRIFTPGDQRFMMTLADKFSINYENLILYQAIEQHVKELEDVTTRLHLTLEAAHVGTWVWSIQTGQLLWDKYACLLLGLKAEAYTGVLDAFLNCLVPEDRKRVRKELLELSKNGKTDPIEFRVVWPDKSIRHLMLRGKVYYNEKNEPSRMLGVYWDITEHIQTEGKLRAYRQQMAEIVRSNSLGEMASSLAHEINQPLAAITAYIKGCIKRLEIKNEVTPEILEVLNEASLQAERAGEVIHRIKNFVRKGELFYETIDINSMVEQTIQLIKYESQSSTIEIVYVPNKDLPLLEVDKIQIQQVILNLLRNAIEAIKSVNIVEPKITINVQQNSKAQVTITVIDNGPGFSEQTASQLFELYFTTKPQGMGLGLTISRSVIEAHSGQLTALVLPQGGSCFQFDLPVKNRSKTPPAFLVNDLLQDQTA
jgi:signal transduction histidine kinase/DNA-binding response OmpR family regulator